MEERVWVAETRLPASAKMDGKVPPALRTPMTATLTPATTGEFAWTV